MKTNFIEKLNAACSACSSDHAMEMRKNSPEYQQKDADYSQLMKKICKYLPEEKESLVFRFEEVSNWLRAFDEDCVYRQGFFDCVSLLRWVGLLENPPALPQIP